MGLQTTATLPGICLNFKLRIASVLTGNILRVGVQIQAEIPNSNIDCPFITQLRMTRGHLHV